MSGTISKFGSVPTQNFVLKHYSLLIFLPNKRSHTWYDIPRETRELKIRKILFVYFLKSLK